MALNAERAAEEKRGLTRPGLARPGLIRWLRPEFQNPEGRQAEQTGIEVEAATSVAAKDKLSWPKSLPEQAQAIRRVLDEQPLTVDQLAAQFKGARRERVEELLQTLAVLGQVRESGDNAYSRG